MNTFPLNFGPEGSEDGRFCRTASGETIPFGGALQFQGYDENGLLRSLKWKTHWCTHNVVHCCRDRVQSKTRFLPRT